MSYFVFYSAQFYLKFNKIIYTLVIPRQSFCFCFLSIVEERCPSSLSYEWLQHRTLGPMHPCFFQVEGVALYWCVCPNCEPRVTATFVTSTPHETFCQLQEGFSTPSSRVLLRLYQDYCCYLLTLVGSKGVPKALLSDFFFEEKED